MIKANDVRREFIQYFEEKGHEHVRSGSLVPYNDPTLLFTNAGMNQFKDVFLGIDKRPYSRATTSQKCVRAGGKHNDLETVGKTARHHTFFEMLGNFSFGDYFKKEAIHYAWTFLTVNLGLPKEKLWITIYKDDDEAHDLWQEETGFPDEKILRLGEKDNFWQMGDIGPCGPCSEIHYDRGEDYACDCEEGCQLGVCDCDRWLEIWNLVFMQYNRAEDGSMTPLPRPSVDTGMGLERITSVLQHVDSNWETDLFVPLLDFVSELSGKEYHKDQRGFPFRVIADHARACTFLIADGVLPSNEGRGYVLRRILRRAVRLGKSIGLDEPFLYLFTEKVCELMGDVYPEIVEQKSFIESTIKKEEERFLQTLQDGLKRVNETVEALKKEGKTEIDGKSAFMFYDTYGFPIDLTKDIAEEEEMTVDVDGFEKAMAKQREMSKASRQQVDVWNLAKIVAAEYPDIKPTKFTGYTELAGESTVCGILIDGKKAEYGYDATASLILDKSPFYAQGGGQIGDSGACYGKNGVFRVENTIKLPDGTYILEGYIDGRIDVGDVVKTEVDSHKRANTARNHTATHILHYVLRDILGNEVHQAGSLVDDKHLRFDFSFQRALTREEIGKIEEAVNARILAGGPVVAREMSIDEARDEGYIALFGEKYGEQVRCIDAAGFSKELCGGTHVKDIATIGLFKIVTETAVSAGVRRIEAVSGEHAYHFVNDMLLILRDVADYLKVNKEGKTLARVMQINDQLKEARKEIEQLKSSQVRDALSERLKNIVEHNGCQVLVDKVQAKNPDELRNIADQYRDKLKNGIVVLGGVSDEGKVFLVGMKTAEDEVKKIHVGQIIKEIAALAGGKGGGRPDMAQAGGKDEAALDEALKQAVDVIKNSIEKR